MKTYLERQKENQELVESFIDNLDVLRDNAWCFIALIDEDTTVDDITEMLWRNNAFDEDVIYYTKAIEYIAKEDPSLRECMELAHELNYYITDLDSEILATLLKRRRNEENWEEAKKDVQDFLDSLDWSYEEE